MLKGDEVPRIHTQPNRPLTPLTTRGFEVIEYVESQTDIVLMPWQKWLLKAILELNEDNTYRYRRVIILVGRQSGKTTLLKALALWTMQAAPNKTVLGVAQDLSISKESWNGVVDLCDRPNLAPLLADKTPVRRSTGDLRLTFANRSRYMIAATNGRSGRGLPVNLLILDELREMKTWDGYQALAPTITAQADGMIVCISNAGEQDSVVLNGLRDVAIAGDEDAVGIFEWSAFDGCELDDPVAWCQANPGLGHTVQESELRVAMATFPPGKFRTEHLCQRVDTIDTAVDLAAWGACADETGTMDGLRDKIALCLDVSLDGKHVTLTAAATRDDGRTRLEVVAAWDSTSEARAALPDLLARVRPKTLGYFPNGPAAAILADLTGVKNARPIKSADVAAVCMGFAEQVTSRRVLHVNDPLINAHLQRAARQHRRDGWVFVRPDGHQVDAVYSAAGAVHLARTLGPSMGKPRILVAA